MEEPSPPAAEAGVFGAEAEVGDPPGQDALLQIGPGKGQGGQGRRLVRGDLLVGVGHGAVVGQGGDGVQHIGQVAAGGALQAVQHIPHVGLVVGQVKPGPAKLRLDQQVEGGGRIEGLPGQDGGESWPRC